MYRISVIDNDSEHTLDMKKSSFPFNFESNDIAQLNDSTASWSYTITLPRTPNNDRILGFAGISFVNSTTPYERKRCNVYMDGLRIIHNGVLIIDSTTKTEYKTQILAGTASVFDLMKAVDFKNWSRATQVTLPGNSLPANTTPAAGLKYSYPMPTKIAVSGNTPQMQTKEDDFYMYATPLLRVGAADNTGVLNSLLAEIGYSFVTDTPDSVLDALWLSMATRKKSSNGTVMWSSSESSVGIDNVITNAGKSRRGHTRVTARFTPIAYYDSHHSRISTASVLSNFVSAGGSVTLSLYDQNYVPGQPNTPLAYIRSSMFSASGNDIVATFDIDDSVSHTEYKTFGGADGTTQWSYYDGSQMTYFTGLQLSSAKWKVQTILDDESETAYSGQQMKLEPNVGIANGMDFFKILSQVFGWTIKIDQDTKTIYAYSFGYITGRKSYAPDWTLKVAQDLDREVDFEFGKYAQENVIQYAENKLGGYRQSTSFAIPNVNLAATETLLDIKVSSGNAERVEQWEIKDDGSLQWKDTGTPHLIIWAAAADTPAHYTLAQVLANYQSLIAAIQATQTISLKMYLTAVDILNFDQFTPIYLKQFGKYFYVNKIKDWEVGKLCTVELLRI